MHKIESVFWKKILLFIILVFLMTISLFATIEGILARNIFLLLFLIPLIYFSKVLISIISDPIYNITIDNEKKLLILTKNNGDTITIPFNHIRNISINSGNVIKAIRVMCIRIKTSENTFYKMNNVYFACDWAPNDRYIESIKKILPGHISKNFKETFFYQPKWNNINY